MITLNKYDIIRECSSINEYGSVTIELYLATSSGSSNYYTTSLTLRRFVREAVNPIKNRIVFQSRSLYNP